MDNLIKVPMTYRSGHMTVAGLGVLLQYAGPPEDMTDLVGLIKAIIAHVGEDGKFDTSRAGETFEVEINLMQLDMAVSAVACLAAIDAKGMLDGSPHTQDDYQAIGEGFDAILSVHRVKGD